MEHFIEIKGIRLRYEVSGNGSPIILMHGWGCNASTLASVAVVAAESHTVYNLDLPGFGGSAEPPITWGVEDYTLLLEAFVKELNIDRPSLLGHSFGGRISILYASRNDVDKLILVDAAGIKPKRKLSYYVKVYSFKAAKAAINLFMGKERARKHIEAMRTSRGSSDYASASPMMKSVLSKVVNEDLTNVLDRIKAPTLLIWGENDTATPLEMAKKINRLVPDSGLVSFPGCGHYSFLDNPYRFAAVLRSFLTT